MRIAQIAPPWLPIPPKNYGGTENVIYNLVEAQVALGHDVTLFAPGDAKTSARLVSFFPKSLIEDGIPWTMHLKAFYHLQKAIEYIKEQSFDIVHTHLSSSSDLYVFPLTAELATPHVTTLHSRFPFDRDAREGKIGDADKYYMDWAPKVPIIAISESSKRQENYPLNYVGVVHNGISMKLFPPPTGKRKDYFAWLGRFVPEKGAHLAIEAARRAKVPLVLAGIVDRYTKDSLEYFQQRIKPEIDKGDITFIGPVDIKQKVKLLSEARGLLNPIEWEEPFGMVMIEAMSQGCPVISFAHGAATELIQDRKTGFLVNNLDEMVARIPEVDTLDQQYMRQYVEKHFSARAMAEKYLACYQRVIDLTMAKTAVYPLARRVLKEVTRM
ncbi:MAG TPA: glycosyltransferase family 4 protein [Ktedonobacteraceae bacterium]|jgi:glycosyltransferase involved in cell wall biosynthesis|nr:glycosyltransferase family 4 protein [Ktedonobacteraceae bacterium]